MIRAIVLRLALVLGICAANGAPAQDGNPPSSAPASDFSLSANVSLASQYRFRGLMQTNNKPAIQGGFDVSHSSGFYLGNWNSNISWLSDSASNVTAPIEMDFYGGYTKKIWRDLSVDLGAIHYYYPGSYPSGFTSPDTTELYVGLGYGPVAFKYSQSLTNLFGVPDSKNSQYYDLKGSFPTGMWGLVLDTHAGYQKVRNLNDGSYTDWSVGLSKSWDNGFSASLAYIDTNADRSVYTNPQGRYIGRAAVLLSVSKKF